MFYVDILLLNACLSFVFCLVVSNNYEADHFHQTLLNSFLKSFLFYFRQQILVSSVVYLLILRLLYYIQPFILFKELLLFLCKILAPFLLIFLKLYTFLTSHKTQFAKLLMLCIVLAYLTLARKYFVWLFLSTLLAPLSVVSKARTNNLLTSWKE